MKDPITWYDTHAETAGALYEQVSADTAHSWLLDLLPTAPATVLDVGAGNDATIVHVRLDGVATAAV